VNAWAKVMKPRSLRRVYGVLRAVMAAAVIADVIGRSPCRGVKLPQAERRPRRLPGGDDLARLAAALGDEYAPMVWLGALCGLRWGEVAGLRVGALDLLRRELRVVEQVTRGEGGRSVIGPPKSDAGRRTIALPEALSEMLSAHLTRRALTAAAADAWVFVGPDGAPLDYSNWRRRVWLPAVERTGLNGVTFHDLRRTSATALVNAGVDIKTAQVRLGHSDVRLTLDVYAQAISQADRNAAETVSNRLMVGFGGTSLRARLSPSP
jgi:integrase